MTNHEFTEIVSAAKPAVLASIQKYLNPNFMDSVDDVAQETYIRIYRYILEKGIESLDFSRLGNWAYTIAKNESIRFNSKRFQEFSKENKMMESIEFKSPQTAISMEDSILDRLEYEEVIKVIPEHYREVLILLEEGRSNIEIADLLNIKPGTVKSRLSRARSYIYEKFSFAPSNSEQIG